MSAFRFFRSRRPDRIARFGIALLVAALIVPTAAKCSTSITNGLILHYTFPTNSGGVVIDETGLGHTATVFEDARYSTQGVPGGSCDFDGDGDYLQTPSVPDLQITGDVTIAAWINAREFAVSGVTPGGGLNMILSKDVSATASEYEMAVFTNTILFFRGNNSSDDRVVGATVLESNRWYHVVCVAEGTVGRIYIEHLDNTI